MNTEYGRATLPGETLFYGTYQERDGDFRSFYNTAQCSLDESCQYYMSPQHGNKAIVAWFEVVRPIRLFTIISPNVFENTSLIGQYFSSKIDDYYSEFDYKTNIETIKEFHSFLFRQFNKEVHSNKEYMLTALITKKLLSGSDLDGIRYESVKSNMIKGIKCVSCIAIKPEIADSNLRFADMSCITTIEENGKFRFTTQEHKFN